ncbi:MAG: hypothetical protein HC888_10055 [Candidatus Competibacteraceae bacterium]|nr:hypothetical protein [Candidatus Competibacteraceae bacterium]
MPIYEETQLVLMLSHRFKMGKKLSPGTPKNGVDLISKQHTDEQFRTGNGRDSFHKKLQNH